MDDSGGKVCFLKVYFPKVYYPIKYSLKLYLPNKYFLKVYFLKVYFPQVCFQKVCFVKFYLFKVYFANAFLQSSSTASMHFMHKETFSPTLYAMTIAWCTIHCAWASFYLLHDSCYTCTSLYISCAMCANFSPPSACSLVYTDSLFTR